MSTPHISLIAALGARTRAIGKDNTLLWHIPGDLPRFKQLTEGHPVIMGLRTFESIGRPLPHRTNIVLTEDRAWTHDGVLAAHSIDEALELAREHDSEELFVIGGGTIYAQTIDRADRLYLTLVDDDAAGDTFFPDYTTLPFVEKSREEHQEYTPHFAFVTYGRSYTT